MGNDLEEPRARQLRRGIDIRCEVCGDWACRGAEAHPSSMRQTLFGAPVRSCISFVRVDRVRCWYVRFRCGCSLSVERVTGRANPGAGCVSHRATVMALLGRT